MDNSIISNPITRTESTWWPKDTTYYAKDTLSVGVCRIAAGALGFVGATLGLLVPTLIGRVLAGFSFVGAVSFYLFSNYLNEQPNELEDTLMEFCNVETWNALDTIPHVLDKMGRLEQIKPEVFGSSSSAVLRDKNKKAVAVAIKYIGEEFSRKTVSVFCLTSNYFPSCTAYINNEEFEVHSSVTGAKLNYIGKKLSEDLDSTTEEL